MCYTDLNRAALEQSALGLEPQDKLESQDGGEPEPVAPRPSPAPRTLSRVWVWGIAAVLIVAVAVLGSRVYQAVQPFSTARSTPSGETTPTRVSRAPTYTFTPTSTATRAPRATATPLPTQTPTATPTSTLTPTPRPTPTPLVHVVQAGETLYSIARHYEIGVIDLSQANGLTTSSVLHPDDELIIPIPIEGATPAVPVSSNEVLHTVQEGERLSDIAQRYAVSESILMRVNNLETAAAVRPGDTLLIPLLNGPAPAATTAPTATPTPGLPYPAPRLLYPQQNAEFSGPGEAVVLQWTSVGILNDGDWYALSLRYLGTRANGQPSEITLYTRITSWRVPEQWYPGTDAPEHRFEWTVQVVHRQDLVAPPTAISLPADLRRFKWL
jgi:LysM repeat protein